MGVKTQRDEIDQWLLEERLFAQLSSFFGFLALLLAAIGLYGVQAYSVSTRTSEIGIRMALGADRRRVLRMVFSDGFKLVLAGITLGLGAALMATRLLTAKLYGIEPTDFITFLSAALLLTAITLLACLIPARRAAKLDPVVALKHE